MTAHHLAGVDNHAADTLSRRTLSAFEWNLTPETFRAVEQRLLYSGALRRPLQVDAFASAATALLRRYWSLDWHDPDAEAYDAFQQDWTPWAVWASPPWRLIPRVLDLVGRQGAQTVVLLAPIGPAQPWYPRLRRMLTGPLVVIPNTAAALRQPAGCRVTAEPRRNPQWRIAAFPITGAVQPTAHSSSR